VAFNADPVAPLRFAPGSAFLDPTSVRTKYTNYTNNTKQGSGHLLTII